MFVRAAKNRAARALLGAAALSATASVSLGCADVRGPGAREPSQHASWDRSVDANGLDSEHGGLAILPTSNVVADGAQQASTRGGEASLTGAKSAPSAKLDGQPFLAPLPELAPDAPASRIAELSDRDCMRELEKRTLPFERADPRAGVATPLHITGPLRGVRVGLPGKASPYGVVDCRLALALDELAGVLSHHGVVALRVDNTYRPGAQLPGKKKNSQHAHALALDITAMELADGRTLKVIEHHTDPIGSTPCGPEATLVVTSEESVKLRNIVCDVAQRGIFHHMLTPSFNAAHRDHYHFDLRRGTKRQSVR